MDGRTTAVLVLVALTALSSAGVVGATNVIDLDGDGVPAFAELNAGTDPLAADTDGDGLDDGAEQEAGTDPTVADTDGDGLADGVEVNEHGTAPTAADTDSDGLTDPEELDEGTDPTAADTDGDGLADAVELDEGTDPTSADTDDDGLADGEEVNEYGSDPTVTDTDDDGLADGPEVNEHGTDPTAADTDGDGLTDPEELDGETDPTAADTDGDGLTDGTELDEGTDPTAADTDEDGLDDGAEFGEYGTDPTAADTDGDGLADGEEVNEHGTNPTKADSDFDGLTDPEELEEGTDPTKADTDGDGLDDVAELEEGTDPREADTDGDGIPDGPEVNDPDLFPDADPLETDVFVEVDVMEGADLPDRQLQRIAERFADAPASNPDGSTGIDLHFVDDETVPAKSLFDDSDWNQYRQEYYDLDGYGYHHFLFVKNAGLSRTDGGTARAKGGKGYFITSVEDSDRGEGFTIMHELGHSVGLRPEDFGGIDAREYSFSEYPSVMNYNTQQDILGYSTGDAGPNDFDDWAHIEENLYVPDTSRIDTSGYSPPGQRAAPRLG